MSSCNDFLLCEKEIGVERFWRFTLDWRPTWGKLFKFRVAVEVEISTLRVVFGGTIAQVHAVYRSVDQSNGLTSFVCMWTLKSIIALPQNKKRNF